MSQIFAPRNPKETCKKYDLVVEKGDITQLFSNLQHQSQPLPCGQETSERQ